MSTISVGGRMLVPQRRAAIRRTVYTRGIATIAELAAVARVSSETIRRDVRALVQAGEVVTVHGGVARPDGSVAAPSPRDPWDGTKDRVGRAAAALVRPGQTVGLSAGTTTLAVARALAAVPGVTIVTNSLPVSRALPGAQVVLTGGVPGIVGALLGQIAVHAVRSVPVDWLFLGTNGVGCGVGVTARDLQEAQLHRAWAHNARSVAVVADHRKWGVSCLATVLPLTEVGALVTDDGLPLQAQRLMRREACRLLLAPAA